MIKSKNIFQSFSFAFRGFFYALLRERNFAIQFLIGILAIGLALYLKISKTELFFVLIVVILVLALELINSAFEKTLNIIHPEEHPKVKEAKDFLAAAVLIASIGAALIGIIIFYPLFFK